jgi:hypothetical protein
MFLVAALNAHLQSLQHDQRGTPPRGPDTSDAENIVPDLHGRERRETTSAPAVLEATVAPTT